METQWEFAAPAEFKELVAYADLNCPFCYALERRLAVRNVEVRVEWRLVEHDPSLPSSPQNASAHEHEELATELEALETRAPDIPLCRPPFRPNSLAAIAAVAAAQRIDIALADELRRALYRALWVRGHNIADPDVICEVAQLVGLSSILPTNDTAQTAADWTAEWRASRLDRIPCLLSNVDSKLVGLTSPQRLDLFLESGLFGSESPDACPADDGHSTDRDG